ncbi:tripartite tricarboxylate transporter substrate binding protein [Polynucleobacter sp. AP-Latsch-80-C2]|jgi:tripartite-type tricarboxylate transporter receptor subunit TctC|uniref:Bug family tripartite tricarboxylate transporter substrate binding protein n=1 Tax=Polynucleobacter sp. AP-Latsch-80-C2 TaxID=2576931 RepID=UPI001C0DB32E|nr:tripartite tricarboxylate transporter substrate binding protein [Polynucleobacter sp. AP-Latsch-80-C2]MBU3624016.1 tripartite tricarboxylate transporter substrate binding protein [Polynucleobacter sp. AP-Latsch-80-C2]
MGLSSLGVLLRVFALAVSFAGSTFALAAYPDRPIKVIVPFAPGGGTDLVARTLSVPMSEDLKQSIVIDNKPGGSTIIGTDALAKSPADGYTLVVATLAHAVNPSLKAKLPYSQDKDFAPVILVGISPNVVVVSADSPYKTFSEFLTAAKANPGKLSFASQGGGTSAHLAGELFNSIAGTKLTHVPYKGAGPALTDVIGGQVDVMFATASAVGSLVESGKLRALAVTTPTRSTTPLLAKLPTVAESGVPGYSAGSWYGYFAPAGTPPAVINRLNASIKKGTQTSAFKARVESEGLIIKAGSPEEFAKFVKAEELRWRTVIKDANISPD